MKMLSIERNDEGVYFVEYSATAGIERFRSQREVREFMRKISQGRFLLMAGNLPLFYGFENYKEIENSFRALYNVRVREALDTSSKKRARTRTSNEYEYA